MQGDMQETFMEAFDAYSDAIFRFCIVKVSSVDLAEDMTQEVFMRYWQYVREGKEMRNTRSLLYTIANNLAKDWYKKKKADSLDARMEDGFDPADARASAATAAEYREVLEVMEEMETTDRTVLLLRYVEGLDPKDIAEIHGESPNAVSVRLHRAEERLRKKLHHEQG